jgi:hypothetical protein
MSYLQRRFWASQWLPRPLTFLVHLSASKYVLHLIFCENECVEPLLHDFYSWLFHLCLCGTCLEGPDALQCNGCCFRGKVVVPYRLFHPWLLMDWIYRLTDVAKHELQQQKDIAKFTRKVYKQNWIPRLFHTEKKWNCWLCNINVREAQNFTQEKSTSKSEVREVSERKFLLLPTWHMKVRTRL